MNDLPKQSMLRVKNRGGAPKGNRNALKTGVHSRELCAWRAKKRDLLLRVKLTLAMVDSELRAARK